MRRVPGFDVNIRLKGSKWTLLHDACNGDSRSAVIPLLLAHPDIDVNLKTKDGGTPFFWACCGHASSVREMLKDSRVKVNSPNIYGSNPLWYAASHDHLDIIKWWIASGREMDLGIPGDVEYADVIAGAKEEGRTEVVTLLERFKENLEETRYQVRVELGLLDALAAEVFAMVVFVSDGLLLIKDTTITTPAARYFSVARRLPLELQMMLCFRQVGSVKEIIPGQVSEVAFKELAKRLILSSKFPQLASTVSTEEGWFFSSFCW